MNEPLKEHDVVELVSMPDDPNPIPVGTRGAVIHVGKTPDETYYCVEWNVNGKTRILNLLDGVDSWKKI